MAVTAGGGRQFSTVLTNAHLSKAINITHLFFRTMPVAKCCWTPVVRRSVLSPAGGTPRRTRRTARLKWAQRTRALGRHQRPRRHSSNLWVIMRQEQDAITPRTLHSRTMSWRRDTWKKGEVRPHLNWLKVITFSWTWIQARLTVHHSPSWLVCFHIFADNFQSNWKSSMPESDQRH